MYKPDVDAKERELLAELEAGDGVVQAAFWHTLVRAIIRDEESKERLRRAARAWRAERGMPDDEPFIVGAPAM